jgi:hypothetical protein
VPSRLARGAKTCAAYQHHLLISSAFGSLAAFEGFGSRRDILQRTGDVAADPLPGPDSPAHRRKGARKLSITSAARTISRRKTASLPALARCEGFRVDSRDGYVGVVDALRYSPSTRWDHPSELAVYAGRASATLLIIPSSEVEGVCLAERRVLLRPSPKIAATERLE